jgi:antitoxin component of MazEF toxin-antitoxin module
MGFKTTITKASSITNSLRTTVPAGVIQQFNLKDGDHLDWELKAENGNIIVIVKPEKK